MASKSDKMLTAAARREAAIKIVAAQIKKRVQDDDCQEPFLLMRQTEREIVREIIEREDRRGGSSALYCLYYAVASYADPDGTNCYPGVTALMRDTNVKKPETIRVRLRGLEAMGLLETTRIHHRHRTRNSFFLPARAYADKVHLARKAREARRKDGDPAGSS